MSRIGVLAGCVRALAPALDARAGRSDLHPRDGQLAVGRFEAPAQVLGEEALADHPERLPRPRIAEVVARARKDQERRGPLQLRQRRGQRLALRKRHAIVGGAVGEVLAIFGEGAVRLIDPAGAATDVGCNGVRVLVSPVEDAAMFVSAPDEASRQIWALGVPGSR